MGCVRVALRALRKNWDYSLFASLSLALGIGGSTAVFSMANAVLMRPLPFLDPDRLVMIWEDASFLGFPQDTLAPANYADWKRRNRVFEGMAALRSYTVNLADADRPEHLESRAVTSNFFSLIGIQPLLGRTFRAEEDAPGRSEVAIISRGLWVRRYGGDPGIVGKSILLSGERHTIVGVMPHGLDYPDPVDVWTPLALTSQQIGLRGNHYLQVVARLQRDITVKQAQIDLSMIARQLEQEYPITNAKLGVVVVPVLSQFLGTLRVGLIALLAAVAGVLLIACANAASLALARSSSRERDMAIRLALGASRIRLIRQLLVESLLVSLFGGLCGVVLAWISCGLLQTLIPSPLSVSTSIQVDSRTLLFSAALVAVTGILFGVVPALRLSGSTGIAVLNSAGRSTVGSRDGHIRNAIVVAEVALASTLLVCSGLLLESVIQLRKVDPGFHPQNVLCARTLLPVAQNSKYRDLLARARFYETVLARVREFPGVAAAGYTTFLPLTTVGGTSEFVVNGRPPTVQLGQFSDANLRVVTPDYLRAIGVPLVAGRMLLESDGPNAAPVALINANMARQYWTGGNPLGRRFKLGTTTDNTRWMTIVGVVGDMRQTHLDSTPRPECYVSYKQEVGVPLYFVPRDLAISVTRNLTGLPSALRRAVAEADVDQPVSDIRPMKHLMDRELGSRKLIAELVGAFTVFALILASVGVYGVMAYTVARRKSEIGLRMALGATPARIFRSVTFGSVRLVCVGLAIGFPVAWLLAHAIRNVLYEISPSHPVLFIEAAVLLGVVSIGAAYIPARRGARLDPLVALRTE